VKGGKPRAARPRWGRGGWALAGGTTKKKGGEGGKKKKNELKTKKFSENKNPGCPYISYRNGEYLAAVRRGTLRQVTGEGKSGLTKGVEAPPKKIHSRKNRGAIWNGDENGRGYPRSDVLTLRQKTHKLEDPDTEQTRPQPFWRGKKKGSLKGQGGGRKICTVYIEEGQ